MTSTLSQAPARTGTPAWLTLSSSQQTLLKWLALALMLLDHANRTLWTFQPWAFALGRIAFPLFAFLIAYNVIVRGVKPERYVGPLLLFGVISQAPAMFALDRDVLPLNIFFSLTLGVSFLPLRAWFAKHLPQGRFWQPLSWLAAIYLVMLLGILVEYGPLGVLLIPGIMMFLNRPHPISGTLLVGQLVLINSPHLTSLTALLAIPAIYAVSTLKLPRLPRFKWFAYGFYPAHLTLLWLVKIIG